MSTHLVTGFPGFLGERLLPRLLELHPRTEFKCLVQSRFRDKAESELARLGIPANRATLAEGDITSEGLGIEAARREAILARLDSVHHLAAVYDLAVGAELAERVNVERHPARGRLQRRLRETSSGITTSRPPTSSGTCARRLPETDLAAGQGFKNLYESTKFAAEVVVRAAMDAVPTTIYRPAIVVGDSRTGETQKFDGPYYMLRRSRPSAARCRRSAGTTRRSTSCRSTSSSTRSPPASPTRTPSAHTLHLVDPEPQSSADIFTLLAREWDGRTPRFRVPPAVRRTAR